MKTIINATFLILIINLLNWYSEIYACLFVCFYISYCLGKVIYRAKWGGDMRFKKTGTDIFHDSKEDIKDELEKIGGFRPSDECFFDGPDGVELDEIEYHSERSRLGNMTHNLNAYNALMADAIISAGRGILKASSIDKIIKNMRSLGITKAQANKIKTELLGKIQNTN